MGPRADPESIAESGREAVPVGSCAFLLEGRITLAGFTHVSEGGKTLLNSSIAHPAGVQRTMEVVGDARVTGLRGVGRGRGRACWGCRVVRRRLFGVLGGLALLLGILLRLRRVEINATQRAGA